MKKNNIQYNVFESLIKDEILADKKKILILRKKLFGLYNKIKSYSKLQHHGLIFYTSKDLNNYLKGYLPPEALKFNFCLTKQKVINLKVLRENKINISKKLLKEKNIFYKNLLKTKNLTIM